MSKSQGPAGSMDEVRDNVFAILDKYVPSDVFVLKYMLENLAKWNTDPEYHGSGISMETAIDQAMSNTFADIAFSAGGGAVYQHVMGGLSEMRQSNPAVGVSMMLLNHGQAICLLKEWISVGLEKLDKEYEKTHGKI
ncbi:MAG: hypothetical protein WCP15_02690 [bacterium]